MKRQIENDKLQIYFKRTHNSIHKLLYLREENCETLPQCIESLLDELFAADELLWGNQFFAQLIFNVQSLKFCIDEFKKFRSRVFYCENICDKIYQQMEGK